MKKYQIYEMTNEFNHAGTKATKDFSEVAQKLNYEILPIVMRSTKKGFFAKVYRQIGYFIDWTKLYHTIKNNSIVLLQHPFHYPQLTRENILYKLKSKKNVKYISVIHDVEELRKFRYNTYYKNEFDTMLKIADIIIVHNSKMAQYFMEIGVAQEKIVILEIFDYLQETSNKDVPKFKKSITIAGNLDTQKCGYIGELPQLKNTEINLYGPNFDPQMQLCNHIHYNGSYPANEIPSKLTEGFGLVWDGNGLDGCTGESGQYLKYNNPHKLSLYLSSGLPVVIWSGAAEATFVKEHGVGICVDSLYDLQSAFDSLTNHDYQQMAQNVQDIAKLLKSGHFAASALKMSETKLGEI